MPFVVIYRPLEQFEEVPLMEYKILGDMNMALTNLSFYCLLALVVIVGLNTLADHGQTLVPSRWSVSLEAAYVTVSGIVRDRGGRGE
jgi:F0F1-type ATP synthase membrane subunit a